MSKLFKRTKILATIGPATFTKEKIEELIMAGVNGCRLNFSHGNYIERDQQIAWIRQAAAKKGRSVAILQDLQGPKIRLGEIKGNHLDVHAGDELILDHACESHDGGNTIPIQYNLADKVKVGEPLSMFDGKDIINLEDGIQNESGVMLLKLSAMCCNSSVQVIDGKKEHTGDPTEVAISTAALNILGLSGYDFDNIYPRMCELPFDSDRKLMTTVNIIDGQPVAIVKGAPDILLDVHQLHRA